MPYYRRRRYYRPRGRSYGRRRGGYRRGFRARYGRRRYRRFMIAGQRF